MDPPSQNLAPLRIAQLAPVIFPTPPAHSGGTERVVHDLTEALVDQGHDVTLIAPSDSRTRARLLAAAPSLSSLRDRHGSAPPGTPAVLEAIQLDLLAGALDRFDIVHSHGEFAPAALMSGRRVPSLTTMHWRVDELDRQLFLAHFDGLAVASVSHAQAMSLPAANRAGTVHHGIDADRYRFVPADDPSRGARPPLAFIGRMTDQKRPDRAIDIARASGRALALAGARDVGNPDYFDRHVAPRLGDGIVHLGEIDDDGKQDLLGRSTALLFPIDWPEPFGLVMIEAMACGTPVIAWKRGSVPEIVEHGVTGFVVETEREAVEAVERSAGLDRARIRRRFEARFTAARMARDYVRLYREVIARASGLG